MSCDVYSSIEKKYCNGAPQSISVVYTTIPVTFFFSQGLLIWIVQITIIFK